MTNSKTGDLKKTSHLQKTKNKLDQISPSFCLAKWKNSTIHLHNGHTQSCHHVRSQKFTFDPKNPASLHNTKDKIQSRQKMLNGKRPSECEYCWKIEDAGEYSDRIHKSSEKIYLDHFQIVVDSQLGEKINPSFLEIAFDNKCQFKCMYCHPAYSSSIEQEIKKFGQYPTIGNVINQSYNKSRLPLNEIEKQKNIDAFWQWWPELSQELEYLRITGGEPLLSPHTFQLIDYLIENPRKRLRFAINTNLGLPLQNIDQFAKKINQMQESVEFVSVFSSIDTVDDQAEYIRFGLETDSFWRNVDHLLSETKKEITFCFVVTVNILSLIGLEKLLRRISLVAERFPNHDIRIDLPHLQYPAHLSIELLTSDFKAYVKSALHFAKSAQCFNELEIQKLERLINVIGSGSKSSAKSFLLRKDFVRFINEYDRRKNLNFKESFPEMTSFYKLCSSSIENFQSSF